MARYRIEDDKAGVSIEITEVGSQQKELLESFRECQAGRCSCPTDEYEKLASMQIEQAPSRIDLRLEPKPGETFDTYSPVETPPR